MSLILSRLGGGRGGGPGWREVGTFERSHERVREVRCVDVVVRYGCVDTWDDCVPEPGCL